MPRWIAFSGLSLLLLIRVAACQASPPQQPPLADRSSHIALDAQNGMTEAELVARALSSNPGLAAERSRIAMAAGDVRRRDYERIPR